MANAIFQWPKLRLNQYSKKLRCYICGILQAGGSTPEHAPPKSWFRFSDCDRFTVPSCDEHNLAKSGRDQSILFTLVKCLEHSALPESVLRLLELVNENFPRVKKNVRMRSIIKSRNPNLTRKLPYVEPNIKVEEWVAHLTAAILWILTGRCEPPGTWTYGNCVPWSPYYLRMKKAFDEHSARLKLGNDEIQKQKFEAYDWIPGWTKPRPYPRDIFAFWFYTFWPCISTGYEMIPDGHVYFRLQFFGQLNFYVIVQPSPQTVALLRKMRVVWQVNRPTPQPPIFEISSTTAGKY